MDQLKISTHFRAAEQNTREQDFGATEKREEKCRTTFLCNRNVMIARVYQAKVDFGEVKGFVRSMIPFLKGAISQNDYGSAGDFYFRDCTLVVLCS